MTTSTKHELQIVQAFSQFDLPEKILRESDVPGLIRGIAAERDAVQDSNRRVESLRNEKKEGNFLTNWWNDRDDKVQDAQIDLNQSIGRLTQKSAQLLVVNTAISKVLNDQQHILLRQQDMLKQQADKLAQQNLQIREHQEQLEDAQRDINLANQGLMEAKGVTQEQAQQLIGCVVRVTEAEKKVEASNRELRAATEKRLDDALAAQSDRIRCEIEQLTSRAEDLKAGFEQQLRDVVQSVRENSAAQDATFGQLRESISAQLDRCGTAVAATEQKLKLVQDATADALNRLQSIERESSLTLQAQRSEFEQGLRDFASGLNGRLAALDLQVSGLIAEQRKRAVGTRWAMVVMGCLVLFSTGFTIAQKCGVF